MKSTSVDIPVHDIALPLEIHEYSIIWFIVITVCVLAVIFMLLKKMRSREGYEEVDERKHRYESLTHIDVTDAKKAAYAITEQGYLFAQDNEEIQSIYNTLSERLERYKYAPKVESIDEESLELYQRYCQAIVV
jgi:hypothetical protein